MKKEVINDIWVRVDVWGGFNPEHDSRINRKKTEAEDFLEFLKDHQSQRETQATIEYDRKTICEFCNWEWEWKDNEEPQCCTKAVEEWNNNNLQGGVA